MIHTSPRHKAVYSTFMAFLLWLCAVSCHAAESIFLYQSPLTTAFFAQNGASYDALLLRWQQHLNENHHNEFRQVNRRQLLNGLPPGVLILSSAVLLDEEERKAIRHYVNNGGNILATWGTGARDGRGKWSGYAFLSSIFDVQIDGSVKREENDWFLNLHGDSPLTWSYPAGKRLFLGKTAESPLRFQAKNRTAVYLDWARMPTNDVPIGAISYSEHRGSRRVYFGFSESSWEYTSTDEFSPLLESTLNWLLHKPQTFLAAWPNGFLSAHLLEMDTEDQFTNAERFARDLESARTRGTFYSLTSISRKHPDLVKRLATRHEIGYHADVHYGFKGKSEEEQTRRIKSMIFQMRESTEEELATKITGFRAPTESYDQVTERVLRQNGIKHHVTESSATDARLPYFSAAESGLNREDMVICLPRTQADDLNYESFRFSHEKTKDSMLRELKILMEMGGLGVLSVHSQNYGEDGSMAYAMPYYVKHLANKPTQAWVVTGGEIASWWRARDRIKIRRAKGNEIEFSVASPGNVNGATLIVTPPSQSQTLKTVVSLNSQGAPSFRIMQLDEFRSAIIFESLNAGDYKFRLQFNNENILN